MYLEERWDGNYKGSRLGWCADVSPEFTSNRVRSSLAPANAALLHTFLGTQIPCLLKMVEGNGARYFEPIPMLMDRMDMWVQNFPSGHGLLYCYPHLGYFFDLDPDRSDF